MPPPPDIGGEQVVRRVRERVDWPIPVLFVTTRQDGEDIVRILASGADDCVVKPLGRGALGAPAGHVLLDASPWRIDLRGRPITLDGRALALTRKEFDLASFLFRNPGRALSRSQLLASVWGHASAIPTRTVDTHASRLRRRLHLGNERG